MWPGFDSQFRRQMWVEFVVGSRPCSEGFSPGSPVFLTPQKPTLSNSNSIWNQWDRKSHYVEDATVNFHLSFIYLCMVSKSTQKVGKMEIRESTQFIEKVRTICTLFTAKSVALQTVTDLPLCRT